MGTYLYTKHKQKNIRQLVRFCGLGLAVVGFIFALYIFAPLLSWHIYLRPAFASSNFASPIPQTTILTGETLSSLLENTFRGANWLPPVYEDAQVNSTITLYKLSIPKLNLIDAEVSTIDTDLTKHLVQFPGTSLPPQKGNAVIFGHSTLPHLYDPENYKTIFARIHDMTVGDKLVVTVNNTVYTYRVTSIAIFDANETSYMAQDYEGSYLTIVTCTPPGTTWKRLVIRTKLDA